mgnify:CR=1 FL=1
MNNRPYIIATGLVLLLRRPQHLELHPSSLRAAQDLPEAAALQQQAEAQQGAQECITDGRATPNEHQWR